MKKKKKTKTKTKMKMGWFLRSLMVLVMIILLFGSAVARPHPCIRDGEPVQGSEAQIAFQDCMCRVHGGDYCRPTPPGAPPRGRSMNGALCKRFGGSFCADADDIDVALRTHSFDRSPELLDPHASVVGLN